MSGTLTYWVSDGGNSLKSLRLTICSDDDFSAEGLAELRRMRLHRILNEALAQGAKLTYNDLSMIMLTSKATIKRDISQMRMHGVAVPAGKAR